MRSFFSSVCAFERVLVIAKEARLIVYNSQMPNEESSVDQGDCIVRKKRNLIARKISVPITTKLNRNT